MNLSYETAKKLKDAGFPQSGKGELHETEEGRKSREEMDMIDSLGTYLTQVIYLPTLSELIEACGDGFTDLVRAVGIDDSNNIEWVCNWENINDKKSHSFGKTPEEAVANLYLALHPVSV